MCPICNMEPSPPPNNVYCHSIVFRTSFISWENKLYAKKNSWTITFIHLSPQRYPRRTLYFKKIPLKICLKPWAKVFYTALYRNWKKILRKFYITDLWSRIVTQRQFQTGPVPFHRQTSRSLRSGFTIFSYLLSYTPWKGYGKN